MEDIIIYPRTDHLPWSMSLDSDDKKIENDNIFKNKIVVMTEKLDGENVTVYRDRFQSRNMNTGNHESDNYLKEYISTFQHDILEGYRVCGENLYISNSIFYDNLESYFYGFSIWDDKNYCLSFDDTIRYFNMFNITHSPILYYGEYDYSKIREIENKLDFSKMEGYVIRVADEFHFNDFSKNVAKFVRKNHKHYSNLNGDKAITNLLKV